MGSELRAIDHSRLWHHQTRNNHLATAIIFRDCLRHSRAALQMGFSRGFNRYPHLTVSTEGAFLSHFSKYMPNTLRFHHSLFYSLVYAIAFSEQGSVSRFLLFFKGTPPHRLTMCLDVHVMQEPRPPRESGLGGGGCGWVQSPGLGMG